jgi:hypothetical protein
MIYPEARVPLIVPSYMVSQGNAVQFRRLITVFYRPFVEGAVMSQTRIFDVG